MIFDDGEYKVRCESISRKSVNVQSLIKCDFLSVYIFQFDSVTRMFREFDKMSINFS